MSNDNKSKLETTVKVYLAGAMEKAEDKNQGNDWRVKVIHELQRYPHVECLNPCAFEKEQLRGLRPNRLPSKLVGYDGVERNVNHWHDLKYAPFDSKEYSRLKRYGRLINRYDIDLVKHVATHLIVYWTKGASGGAGTHVEMQAAYEAHKPVYTVLGPGADTPYADLPMWLHGCTTRIFLSWGDLYKFLEEEFGE